MDSSDSYMSYSQMEALAFQQKQREYTQENTANVGLQDKFSTLINKQSPLKVVPHRWAKEMHAFADGHEIEQKYVAQLAESIWTPSPSPNFCNSSFHFRIKPEPVYPVSRMTVGEMCEAAGIMFSSFHPGLAVLCQTAIRRAIEDGDVKLP
jgi:hypothetical protein